mmetsp:Transcript_6201/g.16544  ORF Transcript_6201/g.16544 Transcript_6201/m.16544 type:complete len:250 (+) Transcript_6201:2410-3159(+)
MSRICSQAICAKTGKKNMARIGHCLCPLATAAEACRSNSSYLAVRNSSTESSSSAAYANGSSLAADDCARRCFFGQPRFGLGCFAAVEVPSVSSLKKTSPGIIVGGISERTSVGARSQLCAALAGAGFSARAEGFSITMRMSKGCAPCARSPSSACDDAAYLSLPRVGRRPRRRRSREPVERREARGTPSSSLSVACDAQSRCTTRVCTRQPAVPSAAKPAKYAQAHGSPTSDLGSSPAPEKFGKCPAK